MRVAQPEARRVVDDGAVKRRPEAAENLTACIGQSAASAGLGQSQSEGPDMRRRKALHGISTKLKGH